MGKYNLLVVSEMTQASQVRKWFSRFYVSIQQIVLFDSSSNFWNCLSQSLSHVSQVHNSWFEAREKQDW